MSYQRNTSPLKMFLALAEAHPPIHSFRDENDFADWKQEVRPKVMATLGDFPARVPLNPELIVEWNEDGLCKRRYLIDVSEFISAEVIVACPENLPQGARLPAILCCHGHGAFGMAPVMGERASAEIRQSIESHNYDYGHQMAKKGFVTYAIDWIGFGTRNDNRKPNLRMMTASDWCNQLYLHATMLGMTSLSINITHGMAATDFVSSLPYVNAERLGVMGLSGGGTMSLWMGLCDDRIKAVEVICYSNLWADFGLNDINYCGMQVAPGLLKLVDVPELQGLLAPKPLLVDIGIYDPCFLVESAMRCYRKVEKIYGKAGASDRLELDLFPGTHAWSGRKAPDFFGKYLGDKQ